MGLTIKSVAQYQSDLQAGIISLTNAFTDWTSGSPELALTQALSRAFGFIQNLAIAIVNFARAGTSFGADLDSYVADYVPMGFTPRLPATFNAGILTFTKNQAAGTTQYLGIGTIIQNPTPSPASAIAYQVIADPTGTNANYSAALQSWVLAAGQTTLAVNAQALVAGTGTNVIVNTLTVIASPGTPFDSVTNATNIQNAQNQELDPALYARFTLWMTGLGGGTGPVMLSQVLSVQAGMTATLNENVSGTDSPQTPNVTIVADDGSGAIPSQTITAIYAAVDLKRAPGMPRTVVAPTNVPLTIEVNGTTIASGATGATVRQAIQTAIIQFVAANGVGGANALTGYVPSLKFPYVPLANLVASFIGTGATEGLASYSSITINGSSADVPLTTFQLATAVAANITVS
ncbi:MAG: putative phage baseplate protein [Candidatus Eremiobacteraeota bacterium]|nr:putative phage baseplate protein [Candidatus Eremiobacteraeota bacterium]